MIAASCKNTEIENQIFSIIKQFLSESGTERAGFGITLNASLDRDLGIGSLEKAELFLRIENAFDIELPDHLIADTKTVKDLINAFTSANLPQQIQLARKYTKLSDSKVDPTSEGTLVDILRAYAWVEPERPHIYLQDETGEEQVINYGSLLGEASKVAAGLTADGMKSGDTVAIMLPTSVEFFHAFMGILLMGGIPVPIYPPFCIDQIEEYTKRESIILNNAEIKSLITFHKAEGISRIIKSSIPSLNHVTTVELLKRSNNSIPEVVISKDDPALIQYTSGSTGDPKGVLLSHFNLISNIKAYGKAVPILPTDVIVSWLPLYHDMGLIGAWLGSFYHGIPTTILSPLSFLNRPERWLWAIHYHRGTLSAGPNFAYELCVKKIKDNQLEGLDLSCWKLALNGSEAIYPETLKRFTEKFKKYGFKEESFFPAYGLAESSLSVAFPALGRKPIVDRIARKAFEEEKKAVQTLDKKDSLQFVCCGKALPGHEIRIVDDEGRALGERHAGRLQFKGPSSMQGYYRNPDATQAIFHNGWWDSGDLAYMADNELYIAGRIKDIIIKAGRNIYPPEIEEITGDVAGIRKGSVIAFGVNDPGSGTENFVIVAETAERNKQLRNKLTAEIIEKVTETISIPPDIVVLVPLKTIPKTSSGKLQRSKCKENFIEGKLEKHVVPPLLQILKIYLKSKFEIFFRFLSLTLAGMYTLFALTIFVSIALPLLMGALFIPERYIRKIYPEIAFALTWLVGCPLLVSGKENLPQNKAVIYVVNHACYLDPLFIMAALPEDIVFIAKKEVLKAPLFRTIFNKTNQIAVDRFDFSKSISSADEIKKKLSGGSSVVFFAEGTFSYATGLRPFKLGAFKIASEMLLPIYPVALKGTRHFYEKIPGC